MSTTPMTAAQWRSQLKKFGQPYRELPTFRDPESGRSSETGKEFGPVHGFLIHHTAGPDDQPNNADDAADSRIVNQGRSGLPGPLAHAGATDDGVIELHTTDRANHAGDGDRDVYNAVVAESYGDYPPRPDYDSVDGNDLLYGLEAYYPGTKAPKAAQYRAMVNWGAAICDFHGWTSKSGIGHKEWTKRKIDPGFVDMAKYRRDVDARVKEVNAPPVTTHTRWAIRETGVHVVPGGERIRNIPAGYKFQVIDGSGSGMNGWVETAAGNWVVGGDTTIWDPALPVPFSVMDWNVENKGDADAALDRAEVIKLCAERKPTYFCLQEVYRLDLSDIPGYQTYQAWDGYTAESENRAQAILIRDDVALKIMQALQMTEEWTGPKMGLEKEPRVHRYVTGNLRDINIPVATFHVPFPNDGDRAPIEETKLAAIAWLKEMRAAHGRGVIVGDWNSLADLLQAKVGDPAGATVDGGGLDKAVFVGLKKVKGENLGNRGRSDHPVKIWTFEA
jgi:hypothetical protein